MHAACVSNGSSSLAVRVVADGAPQAKCGVMWVSMSGLPSITLPSADAATPLLLTPLALSYIRALHSAVTMDDVGLLLEGRGSGPWL